MTTVACIQKPTLELCYGHFVHYCDGICHIIEQKHEKKNVFISLINDQLDAQFFYFIIRLLQSSTCFEQRRVHHQEVKLY